MADNQQARSRGGEENTASLAQRLNPLQISPQTQVRSPIGLVVKTPIFGHINIHGPPTPTSSSLGDSGEPKPSAARPTPTFLLPRRRHRRRPPASSWQRRGSPTTFAPLPPSSIELSVPRRCAKIGSRLRHDLCSHGVCLMPTCIHGAGGAGMRQGRRLQRLLALLDQGWGPVQPVQGYILVQPAKAFSLCRRGWRPLDAVASRRFLLGALAPATLCASGSVCFFSGGLTPIVNGLVGEQLERRRWGGYLSDWGLSSLWWQARLVFGWWAASTLRQVASVGGGQHPWPCGRHGLLGLHGARRQDLLAGPGV
ncbi:hypothetical protein VPH35_131521 [Triticum aestivum]